jgi:hypothetical protein
MTRAAHEKIRPARRDCRESRNEGRHHRRYPRAAGDRPTDEPFRKSASQQRDDACIELGEVVVAIRPSRSHDRTAGDARDDAHAI